MARRTMPTAKRDDALFPVRVKIRTPQRGFGQAFDQILIWLREEVGENDCAVHSATAIGSDATAFYFRDPVTAQRFVDCFPELKLADGGPKILS